MAAEVAARSAMATAMAEMPVKGRVVAGRCGTSDCGSLCVGEETGGESGPWLAGAGEGASGESGSGLWDVVVDPLQAPRSLADGIDGAICVLAAGPEDGLMHVPEMYMQKIVVPAQAIDAVVFDAPVGRNIAGVAAALGKSAEDLLVIVLDRPRHDDLVREIRQAGARVRLIRDGDVSAGLAVAVQDSGVDVYMGIGGSTEGILTAAALRCLGGEMLARFWPISRHQVALLAEAGIDDVERVYSTADMAEDGVLFCATAVTEGRSMRGVRVRPEGLRTDSMLMCSACHAVRKIRTTHRVCNDGPQVALSDG